MEHFTTVCFFFTFIKGEYCGAQYKVGGNPMKTSWGAPQYSPLLAPLYTKESMKIKMKNICHMLSVGFLSYGVLDTSTKYVICILYTYLMYKCTKIEYLRTTVFFSNLSDRQGGRTRWAGSWWRWRRNGSQRECPTHRRQLRAADGRRWGGRADHTPMGSPTYQASSPQPIEEGFI